MSVCVWFSSCDDSSFGAHSGIATTHRWKIVYRFASGDAAVVVAAVATGDDGGDSVASMCTQCFFYE